MFIKGKFHKILPKSGLKANWTRRKTTKTNVVSSGSGQEVHAGNCVNVSVSGSFLHGLGELLYNGPSPMSRVKHCQVCRRHDRLPRNECDLYKKTHEAELEAFGVKTLVKK